MSPVCSWLITIRKQARRIIRLTFIPIRAVAWLNFYGLLSPKSKIIFRRTFLQTNRYMIYGEYNNILIYCVVLRTEVCSLQWDAEHTGLIQKSIKKANVIDFSLAELIDFKTSKVFHNCRCSPANLTGVTERQTIQWQLRRRIRLINLFHTFYGNELEKLHLFSKKYVKDVKCCVFESINTEKKSQNICINWSRNKYVKHDQNRSRLMRKAIAAVILFCEIMFMFTICFPAKQIGFLRNSVEI